MKRKPDKVEEPTAPYAPKKVAPPAAGLGVRYADLDSVRKSNTKLMQVHREVLQKLAK